MNSVLYRLALGAVAAIATAVLMASRYEGFPISDRTVVLLIGVVVTVRLVEPAVRVLLARRLAAQTSMRNSVIEEVLKALFVSLMHEPGIDALETRLACLVVRRRLLRRALEPVIAFGLQAEFPARVRWTKGKGAAGRAWETQTVVALNAPSASARTKSEWDALSEDERVGLSYRDHLMLRGRHRASLAVPICARDGSVWGCLVVDGRNSDAHTLTTLALRPAQEAASTLGNLAEILRVR